MELLNRQLTVMVTRPIALTLAIAIDEPEFPLTHPVARTTRILNIGDFTNGCESDVDAPIRHAKPDRRTHTRGEPHRRDIPQPSGAVALR